MQISYKLKQKNLFIRSQKKKSMSFQMKFSEFIEHNSEVQLQKEKYNQRIRRIYFRSAAPKREMVSK